MTRARTVRVTRCPVPRRFHTEQGSGFPEPSPPHFWFARHGTDASKPPAPIQCLDPAILWHAHGETTTPWHSGKETPNTHRSF